MAQYIKAQKALKRSVVYTDDEGRNFRYFDGTVAWRNHNPGNMRAGKISRRHNQIGIVNGFAVFPDYQSGHNALIDLIKTQYWDFSIVTKKNEICSFLIESSNWIDKISALILQEKSN